MSLPPLNASINFQLNSANISSVIRQLQSQVGGVSLNINTKSAQQNLSAVNSQLKRGADFVDNFALAIGNSARKFSAYAAGTLLITKLINIFRATTSELIRFDKEIVKLAQITETTVDNMAGLKKELLELSVRTGISASKLAEMTGVLAQAGIKGKELTTVIETLAKTDLAATFDNITETAEGLIAVKSQFKLFGSEITEAFDQINQVAKEFAVESVDLIEAVKKAGGVFAASGGKLDEFLAVITSVRATTRESAESIATGLRTIFARVQRPKTLDFLRQYGVELANLEGEFVGPYEAIERLSSALKEQGIVAGTIEFSKIAEELGGIRQLSKFIPLITESALRTDVLAAAQKRAAGSLDKDMATGLQSVSRQLEILRAEFNKMIIGFQDDENIVRMAKTLLSLATSIVRVTDSLRELAPLLVGLATVKLGSIAAGFFGKTGHFATDTPGLAVGGKVIGGSGNKDDVLARLMGGEFVINKKSAKKIGYDRLEKLNEYAKGGLVTGGNAIGLGGVALAAGAISTGFGGEGAISEATSSLASVLIKVAAGLYVFEGLSKTVGFVDKNLQGLGSSTDVVETEQKQFAKALREFQSSLRRAGIQNPAAVARYRDVATQRFAAGDSPAVAIREARLRFAADNTTRGVSVTGGRVVGVTRQSPELRLFELQKKRADQEALLFKQQQRSEQIAVRTNIALAGLGIAAAGVSTAFSVLADIAGRQADSAIEEGDRAGAIKSRASQLKTSTLNGIGQDVAGGAIAGSAVGGQKGAVVGLVVGAIKSAFTISNKIKEDAKILKETGARATESNVSRNFNLTAKNISGLQAALSKTSDPTDAASLKTLINQSIDTNSKFLLGAIEKAKTQDPTASFSSEAEQQVGLLSAKLEDLLSKGGNTDEINKTSDTLNEFQRYLKVSAEVIEAEQRARIAVVKGMEASIKFNKDNASAVQQAIFAQIRLTNTVNGLEDRLKGFQRSQGSAELSGEFAVGQLSGTRFRSSGTDVSDFSRSGTPEYQATIDAFIKSTLDPDLRGAASRLKGSNAAVDRLPSAVEGIFASEKTDRAGAISTAIDKIAENLGITAQEVSGKLKGDLEKAFDEGILNANIFDPFKEALGGKEAKEVARAIAAIGTNADGLADSLAAESKTRKLFLDVQIGYLTQLNSLALQAKRTVNPSDLGGNRRKTAQGLLEPTGIKLTGDDAGDLRGLSKEALSLQQELQDLKRSVELGVIENDTFQHKQREITDRFNSVSEAMNVLADATDEATLAIERERAKQDALRGAAGDLAFGSRDNARQTSLLLRGVSHLQSGGRAGQFGEEQRDKLYQFLQKFGDVRVFNGETGNEIINREIAQWARENGASQEQIQQLLGDIKTPEQKQLTELIEIKKILLEAQRRDLENGPKGFAPEDGVGKPKPVSVPNLGGLEARGKERILLPGSGKDKNGLLLQAPPLSGLKKAGESLLGIGKGASGLAGKVIGGVKGFLGGLSPVQDLREPESVTAERRAMNMQVPESARKQIEAEAELRARHARVIEQETRANNDTFNIRRYAEQNNLDFDKVMNSPNTEAERFRREEAVQARKQLEDDYKKMNKKGFFKGGILSREHGVFAGRIGEGIVNEKAMRKIGPEGFNRLNQTGSMPGYESFASAVQALQKAPTWVREFRASVDALSGTSIKAELAPVSVNVRINGAEVLASLTEDMQILVRDEILVAVGNLYHSDGTGKHSVRGR